MKQNFLKIYYICTGAFAGLGALYFLVKAILGLINPDNITAAFETLDIIAFISLGISLLMLVVIVLAAAYLDKKTEKKQMIKEKEKDVLSKYKTKK